MVVTSTTQTIEGPDITNYWQYFNLDRDPYAMHAEDALVFLPSYWEEMLDLIQYLIHYKNQIVVVTGQAGIGKSVLSDLLLAQLGENVSVAKIHAESGLTVPRLMEFLGDSFALPWQPEQGLEEALDQQLQAFQLKEKNCLLVVDNTHLLPTETLEALLYLIGQQSDSQMRFHVLLLGESSLAQTLQRMLEPSEESLIHFISLESLSLEETEQYLNHRLSASGWQGDNPMSEEIITRIYRLSEGNPARINRIARRFLLDVLNEQQQDKKEASFFQKHLTKFLGIILLLAIALVLVLWLNTKKPFSPHFSSHVLSTKVEAPTISMNGQPLEKIDNPPSIPTPAPESSANSATAPVTPTPVASAPVAPTPVSIAATAPVAMPVSPAPIQPMAPAVPVKTVAPLPVLPTPTAINPSPVVTPAPAPVEPAQVKHARAKPEEVLPKVESKMMGTKATPEKVINTKPKKPVATPIATKAKQKATAPAATGLYTIQLLGLSKKDSLETYLKENHLEGKVQEIITHHHGEKTRMVTYGHYSTMAEAERAVATLPPELLKEGPWPTKLS